MIVMEWLDDNVSAYSEDGHAVVTLKSLSVSFIDTIAGIVGFGEAMAEVGWLRVENGDLTFVNAGRHNGNSAKNRMLAADRKRSERSRKSHGRNVTKKRHLSSLLVRTEKEGVQGEPSPEVPLLLNTVEFRSAWGDWLKHRREKKKPVQPGSLAEREQLKKLEDFGPARAIAAIRHSISNDYQGIFESNEHGTNQNRRTNTRSFTGQPNYDGVTDK